MTIDYETYDLVIMRRNPSMIFDEQLRQLNKADHGAYIVSLEAAGSVAARGPILEQPSEQDTGRGPIHGLIFFATSSLDETRRLIQADAAVQTGRLIPEIITWRTASGKLTCHGRPAVRTNESRWT